MSTRGKYDMRVLAGVALLAELAAWMVLLGGWWLLGREVPAFRFDKPELLKWMLAGPVLVLVFLLHAAWRNRALGRFASPATLPRMVRGISNWRTLTRFLLLRHGLGLTAIALAGPQLGTRYDEVQAEGIDVVVAIDVSNSMACEDLKPSRMEAARRTMAQLIDRMRGDRIGIVVFAGEAYVQLPITADRSAAKLFLNTIGTHSVGTQGTAIGAAIELAQRGFDPELPGGKAIIVITDGENHEDDADGAARRAAAAGITVHTVGMGTPQGGPIPVRRNGQLTGFRKDRQGNTVVSRLDEEMLRRIAAAGNGTYVRATGGSAGIAELVEELRGMDPSEAGTYRIAAHADQFQYPLGAGIVLLLIGMVLGERGGARRRWKIPAPLGAVPLVTVLLSACGTPQERAAERALRAGNAHYRADHFPQADTAYATAPEDVRATSNRGNALYRLGAWKDAAARFQEAVALDSAGAHRAHAAHNLGNALLMRAREADSLGHAAAREMAQVRLDGDDIARKVGLYLLRDSLRRERVRMEQLTDSALAQGASAYKNALRLSPGDEDARHNLAAALRLIASRSKAKGDKGKDDEEEKDKELTEKAKLLIGQADELVDQHRFKDALELLREGLRKEPSLKNKKEYMDKLETVNKAANAT